MRKYLLGAVDDESAALLEKRYFTDPAFFDLVQMVERELISDYLEGRLGAAERADFESRYCRIPELKKRLEEVRRTRPVPSHTSFHIRWSFVLAAVLAVCLAFGWLFWQRGARSEMAVVRPPASASPILLVYLTPGVTMGADSRQKEFIAPDGGRVSLTFELPGRPSAVECRATLEMVGADGGRSQVWTSGSVTSSPEGAGHSQVARVEVASAALRRGDYVAQLASGNGTVLETYAFRVQTGK